MAGNPGEPSAGGENLMKFVVEENLEILNVRDLYPTHIDRSDGVSRILDVAITNAGKKISGFKVDRSMEYTPYRLVKEKAGHTHHSHSHHP